MTTYERTDRYYADPAEMLAETVCDRHSVRFLEDKNTGNTFEIIMDKLPLAVIVIGIVTSLVGYVKFIITGGYAEAIANFKEYGLFSFNQNVFVNSTATYVYNKFIVIPVAIILIVSLVYSIRKMLQTGEQKGKKVAAVVLLIAGIVGFLAIALFNGIKGELSRNLTTYGGMACIAMVIYAIVVLRKDPNTKPVLRAVAIYFLGLPALVWGVENVIGFGSIVLGLILAGGAVALFISFMGSMGDDS
ncbi:MAG: hypothetical protein J5961_06135, partial [Mogibacterium sp.]|nr:hypothetical protein [Mogibacterium sp.]